MTEINVDAIANGLTSRHYFTRDLHVKILISLAVKVIQALLVLTTEMLLFMVISMRIYNH